MIVLAGLGGPLLALLRRSFVPVMIGEIAAGAAVGASGLGAVHPANATTSLLSQVGFAMLMLTAGMHLPLRDPRLLASLRSGALLAVLVGVLAVPGGIAAAALAGTSHAAVYAVVLASGSAAVLLPALQESGAAGRDALAVMAQVTIADVVTIVSVPIVLHRRARPALLGGALVAAAVVAAVRRRAAAERARLGAPRPRPVQAAPLGAGPALGAAASVPARLAGAEERHERADRGLRRGRDGRAHRRAQTAVDADPRRSRKASSSRCTSSSSAPSSTSAACSGIPSMIVLVGRAGCAQRGDPPRAARLPAASHRRLGWRRARSSACPRRSPRSGSPGACCRVKSPPQSSLRP